MDTLHERLADLAEEAPTGGAPPAELWARGKRAHRLRAAAVAATVLVVGAVGTGLGVRLADGDASDPAPAGTVGFALPIEYPVGEELPDLGETPGPLAAVWVVPRAGGGATDVVGLVAETGRFGTLPIEVEVWTDPDPRIPGTYGKVALSPDGRRVAFVGPEGDLIVRDLVSGETHPWEFEFGIRGYTWADATHLLGRVAKGYDDEGWVWEPGTSPELVDFYTVPYGGTDLALPMQGGGPRECSWSPSLHDAQEYQQLGQGPAFEVPMLCDVLGITASEVLLGHWKSADPNDGNRTVVALDIQGAVPDCRPREPCQLSIDDPGRRRVVVTARAPEQVSFASDLIEDALDAEASAS